MSELAKKLARLHEDNLFCNKCGFVGKVSEAGPWPKNACPNPSCGYVALVIPADPTTLALTAVAEAADTRIALDLPNDHRNIELSAALNNLNNVLYDAPNGGEGGGGE